jgi:hypothetical protein
MHQARWSSDGRFSHPRRAHRVGVQRRPWHRHRHRGCLRFVIIGRSLVMSFCNGCKPIGFRRPSLQAVVVSKIRVPVEEKQVGVEEFAVLAKHPHKHSRLANAAVAVFS